MGATAITAIYSGLFRDTVNVIAVVRANVFSHTYNYQDIKR